jgi:hypothetical protein
MTSSLVNVVDTAWAPELILRGLDAVIAGGQCQLQPWHGIDVNQIGVEQMPNSLSFHFREFNPNHEIDEWIGVALYAADAPAHRLGSPLCAYL